MKNGRSLFWASYSKTLPITGEKPRSSQSQPILSDNRYSLPSQTMALVSPPMNCPVCLTEVLPAATDGAGAVPLVWACICAENCLVSWSLGWRLSLRKESEPPLPSPFPQSKTLQNCKTNQYDFDTTAFAFGVP